MTKDQCWVTRFQKWEARSQKEHTAATNLARPLLAHNNYLSSHHRYNETSDRYDAFDTAAASVIPFE
jgi:hypothetical protein